jgi:hypothetical protein
MVKFRRLADCSGILVPFELAAVTLNEICTEWLHTG